MNINVGKPMLFVTNSSEFGGAEVDLLNILKYLKMRNADFALACKMHGQLSRFVQSERIPVIPVDLGSGFGKWRGLNMFVPTTYLQCFRLYKSLKRAVSTSNFKVIHVQQDLKEKVLTCFVGKLLGLPVVWAEHGLVHPWILSSPFRYLYKFCANRLVAGIVCPAYAVKDQLSSCIGIKAEKITVVHNGVPDVNTPIDTLSIRQEFGLNEADLVVCSIARLFYPKGIQDLIRAASALSKNVPHVKVLIIGDGKYRPELERLAQELGVNGSVVFTGFRPNAAELISACDIYVSASFDTESLPLVILEAMAASKPVVGVDVGGVSECVINGKTGFLVPPRNVDAIASAIEMLAVDTQLRETMGEEGKSLYQKQFTVEQMCESTVSLLQYLAAMHGKSQRLRQGRL